MRTLITGGEGVIGSALARRLVELGIDVVSLDNNFVGAGSALVAGVDYRKGHTRDIFELVSEPVEVVYHLGEYSRVERSLTEPSVVWGLNTIGTLSVVEYARQTGAKLIYAGSSTKFGDGGFGRDQSPYAWSKAVNSELVRNYGAWYGLKYAIAYFYNVYGPGERAGDYGTLVEIFRQQYLSGRPLTVRRPGVQRRNFTHIDDIVDALVLIGERGEGDDFGLGSDQAFSVLEVAELFGGPIEFLPEVAGNRMSAEIDTSKTRLLGWAARRSLVDYVVALKQAAAG